jgi:hypothetical protein
MEVRVNFAYSRFNPLARAPGSYCIGDFWGRRAGLDVLGERKILVMARDRMQIVGRPASFLKIRTVKVGS